LSALSFLVEPVLSGSECFLAVFSEGLVSSGGLGCSELELGLELRKSRQSITSLSSRALSAVIVLLLTLPGGTRIGTSPSVSLSTISL